MDPSKVKSTVLIFLATLILLLAAVFPGEASTPAGANGHAGLEEPTSVGLQVKGHLTPARWVNLSFPGAGQISEIEVEEGDTVSQATLLARQGDIHALTARLAAAELELLLSQQAYEDLIENARLELALAEQRLAVARKTQEMAAWKARSIAMPASPLSIAQAHANLLLAEKSLQQAREDHQDAERFWKDRRDPLWGYVSRRAFRLNLTMLGQKVAQAEDRYDDALEKLEDLRKPADAIDVQMAQADLAEANAQVDLALRQAQDLKNGPDRDRVDLALARLHAAEQDLIAVRSVLADRQLFAPFDGVVASLPAKAGEWLESGQMVMVLADLSRWQVQIEDLSEEDVPAIWVGQSVEVALDALPDLKMRAVVESIDLVYTEKDGDPTYTVTIALPENDPRMRWGMTARLIF